MVTSTLLMTHIRWIQVYVQELTRFPAGLYSSILQTVFIISVVFTYGQLFGSQTKPKQIQTSPRKTEGQSGLSDSGIDLAQVQLNTLKEQPF